MDDWVIILRAVAKAVLLPPTGLLLPALVGVLTIRRHPRAGRTLALCSLIALFALSTPMVAMTLVRLLDTSPPFDPAVPSGAQAIVILGGGVRRDAREYDGDTLGRLTLERVRYGARLARATQLPVLVSGGSLRGGSTEASLMTAALQDEYSVAVRWAEGASRNTRENARNSAAVLLPLGINRIALVVHSFDVPRARAEFTRQGIEAIPAPTGLPSLHAELPGDLLPSVAGLQTSYYACYELLALAATALSPSTSAAVQPN
jgi:uncharacterized SAM-binding protein YcdF (DUF218 family)